MLHEAVNWSWIGCQFANVQLTCTDGGHRLLLLLLLVVLPGKPGHTLKLIEQQGTHISPAFVSPLPTSNTEKRHQSYNPLASLSSTLLSHPTLTRPLTAVLLLSSMLHYSRSLHCRTPSCHPARRITYHILYHCSLWALHCMLCGQVNCQPGLSCRILWHLLRMPQTMHDYAVCCKKIWTATQFAKRVRGSQPVQHCSNAVKSMRSLLSNNAVLC